MFEFTHHVWSEKYRPQIIDDCILPKNTKSTIKGFIESGQLPSLLLHGPAGTGKTLFATEFGIKNFIEDGYYGNSEFTELKRQTIECGKPVESEGKRT